MPLSTVRAEVVPEVSIVESRSLGEPAAPSQQSLLALSWLNFFLSGMQTAFGPIAAAYLAAQGWTAKDVGFVLSIGGTASLFSQVPGGELVDAVRAKRPLVGTAVLTIALSVLIFRLWPGFAPVALAEVLQGIPGGVLGPAVVAISLGLVGHTGLAERLGQNQRFAAAGGVAVTLAMAFIAYSESPWAMFVPVVLAVPVLIALRQIRDEEVDFERASGAEPASRPSPASEPTRSSFEEPPAVDLCRLRSPVSDRQCIHDAARSGMLAYEGKREAAPLVAALIIVPQLLVGLLAPWVGQWTEKYGRKTLLLIGFAALPIRAVLFALISNSLALIVVQLLDVITGAVLGLLTVVVIADMTKGTGRFNLAQGMFGTVMGVGATLSPTLRR